MPPSTTHRRLIVLTGTVEWCHHSALTLLDAGPTTLWIGDTAPVGIPTHPPGRAHKVLGGECDRLVFDTHGGFDPDAFGAAAGTLRGGGVLLLLMPPAGSWPSPFLQRLERLLRDDAGVEWLTEGERLPTLIPPPPTNDLAPPTVDQLQTIDALHQVVHGHRRRPLVITSDRGRGKSSALGMAAAQLLQEGVERVVVTAPRIDAVEPLFNHAERALEGAERGRGRIQWRGRRIEFQPPDELLTHPSESRLLLVDEAAAIPAPMLERLLRDHARIAFATTIHGYEGSGRGFAIRFRRTLDTLTPGWRALTLNQPVRWAEADPLEQLTFRALCLDASPAEERTVVDVSRQTITIERIEGADLARDEETLAQLFGLLVSAHYRTTPGDLEQMLDDPAISLWVARYAGAVAATALVVDEGGFDTTTAEAIFGGRRRPRGHLLAQSLALHAGQREAPTLRFARIQRIAVHPAAHGRGVGRALVEAVATDATRRGRDALGASFGADPRLLRFWRRCELLPLHLGFTRDHASGHHSAMVLRPLGERGEALARSARQRFGESLPLLLGGPLNQLDPQLACELLRHCPPPPPLSEAQRHEVTAVAHANRGIDATLVALRTALLHHLAEGRETEPLGAPLAVARVLQQRGWEACATHFGLTGRKQCVAALRRTFAAILIQ